MEYCTLEYGIRSTMTMDHDASPRVAHCVAMKRTCAFMKWTCCCFILLPLLVVALEPPPPPLHKPTRSQEQSRSNFLPHPPGARQVVQLSSAPTRFEATPSRAGNYDDLVFYARVPKTGSITLALIFEKCAAGILCTPRPSWTNHGIYLLGNVYGVPPMNESHGDAAASDRATCDALRRLQRPGVITLHHALIDWRGSCGWGPPQVLFMVREPLARARSYYNFMIEKCICEEPPLSWCGSWFRAEATPGGRARLCGNASKPGALYSFEAAALAQSPTPPTAKAIAREALFGGGAGIGGDAGSSFVTPQAYLAPPGSSLDAVRVALRSKVGWVGVLEELHLSLAVLRALLPAFFGGLDVDRAAGVHLHKGVKKSQLDEATTELLHQQQESEMQIYRWAVERLHADAEVLLVGKPIEAAPSAVAATAVAATAPAWTTVHATARCEREREPGQQPWRHATVHRQSRGPHGGRRDADRCER